MSKRMERAKALRADPNVHYNCAQSVLIPFAADCGLTEEQANRLGAHFGSGMKMGATCGAITGALMVLGMMGGGDEAYRALMAAERESHANVVDCAGLLKRNQESGGEKKPHCDAMVFEAVALAERALGLE